MWAVARVFANPRVAQVASRRFATKEQVAVTDVRKGMILRYDERYCQVKEWYAHKQGRGAAAYHVTYDELDTGKQRVQKFGSGVKLVKVEPDKQECQVMYVKGSGADEKIVVLADDEYNEIEIPLARFIGYSTVNEGATAVLYKDDEEIVKIVVK
eukprot:s3833_g2.t1